jgi:hypothetical protein
MQFKRPSLLKDVKRTDTGAYEQWTRHFAPALESGGQEPVSFRPFQTLRRPEYHCRACLRDFAGGRGAAERIPEEMANITHILLEHLQV